MSKEKETDAEIIDGETTATENKVPDTEDTTAEAATAEPDVETTTTATPQTETLVDKIKALIAHGANQRIIVTSRNGHSLIEVSVVVGLAVAGLSALLFPWLTLILVAVGLLTRTSLNVVTESH